MKRTDALLQALLDDLAYSEWATQRLLHASAQLSKEEQERDLRCSYCSVLQTLYHLYDAERFWIDCLRAGNIPPLAGLAGSVELLGERLQTFAAQWPKVWHDTVEWLSQQTAATLAHELTTHKPDGSEFALSQEQVLRHMFTHSTGHRGQVVTMLRMLGHQPPNIDRMGWYLSS